MNSNENYGRSPSEPNEVKQVKLLPALPSSRLLPSSVTVYCADSVASEW